MNYFSLLPEGLIAEILSLTSPRDACRSSAVSHGFKSAAESNIVWKRFLPSDYQQIISRAVTPDPVVSPTMKDLYFRLSNFPILLDGGQLSFSLEKETGKKCYMLPARELVIIWGSTPQYWTWPAHPESRFSEVAELQHVCWLEIKGKTGTQMLSRNTTYAAYFVFKIAEENYMLKAAKVYVRLVKEAIEDEANGTAINVYWKSNTSRHATRQHVGRRLPKERTDGWMEIEMGEFFIDQGDAGEVEMYLTEITSPWKRGLIVEGIELRPKENR
ncbi:hypothetical protein F0562_000133 [Nyssa sinensis]|uniref:F-box domain-containing protein n=1 Tax=Nyssa sinensis TaxID=561372 RepID=A0A5J5BZS1_9ASTE|nr:hypothetical protein F0562_000133 [Nyssa sinensis]